MDDHKDRIVASMDNFYIKSEEIEDKIDGKMEYGNTFHNANRTDVTDCPDVAETEHTFPKYETDGVFLEDEKYDVIDDIESGTTPLVKVEEEPVTQNTNVHAGYDVVLCITPEEPFDETYSNVKVEDNNHADHISEVCDEEMSTVGGSNPRTDKQNQFGQVHHSSAANIKSETSAQPGSCTDDYRYDKIISEDSNEEKFTEDECVSRATKQIQPEEPTLHTTCSNVEAFSHVQHISSDICSHGVPNGCPVCYTCFKRPSDVEKHMFMNSGKTSNSCTLSGNLSQPMSIHSRKTQFICNVCQKSFARSGSLKTHMVIHSGKRTHICTICHKGFTRVDCLKTHLLIHSGEWPHICTVCSKGFAGVGSLQTHMLIHSGDRPHKCTMCNKSFVQVSNLTSHMFVHSGERPHKCTMCNKSFAQAGDLNRHKFIHSGERPHTCTVCNKSFTLVGNLIRHTLIHSGERPHKCTMCNDSFANVSSLTSHTFVHSGERPHKCTMCNKSFARVSTLTSHMFVHSGEWPHKCTVCNRGFAHASSLQIHMFIHSGERPHTCTVCNKGFTRTGTLIKHMLVHSGERPHKCT